VTYDIFGVTFHKVMHYFTYTFTLAKLGFYSVLILSFVTSCHEAFG